MLTLYFWRVSFVILLHCKFMTIFKKNTEDVSILHAHFLRSTQHTIRCLRIVATDIKSVILLRIKVKLKLPFSIPWRRIEGVEVQLYLSFNSAPDGGEWSTSRTGRINPQAKNPGTSGIRGWVDPRAGLDVCRRGKSLAPTGIRTPDCSD